MTKSDKVLLLLKGCLKYTSKHAEPVAWLKLTNAVDPLHADERWTHIVTCWECANCGASTPVSPKESKWGSAYGSPLTAYGTPGYWAKYHSLIARIHGLEQE